MGFDQYLIPVFERGIEEQCPFFERGQNRGLAPGTAGTAIVGDGEAQVAFTDITERGAELFSLIVPAIV